MHVKRHLNQLFGSFRSNPSKNQRLKIPFKVEEQTQSRWELVVGENEDTVTPTDEVDGEIILEDIEAQIKLNYQLSQENDTTTPTRTPSLLKRTFSRKKNKTARIPEELEDSLEFQDEAEREELRSVVEEINKTIGLMSQFAGVNDHQPEMNENVDQVEEETCGWCAFEDKKPPETDTQPEFPVSHDINEIVTLWEENDGPSITQCEATPQLSRSGVSGLRNSGRKLYNRILGKRSRLQLEKVVPLPPTPAITPTIDGWVRRSFKKVIKRTQTLSPVKNEVTGPTWATDIIHIKAQEAEPKSANGIKSKMKKSLMGFGRSMIHASAVMPLPCEYPSDNTYPNAYYDEDENSFYEFRKYCQGRKWDERGRVERTYQVGYCP